LTELRTFSFDDAGLKRGVPITRVIDGHTLRSYRSLRIRRRRGSESPDVEFPESSTIEEKTEVRNIFADDEIYQPCNEIL
jgi:hypothetical protein